MDDLISRAWLTAVVEKGWIKLDTQEDYNRIIHLVRDIAPSVEPTLYGYKIEHLAYIARVMEKEGITAEDAALTFNDIGYTVSMIRDEMRQKMEEVIYDHNTGKV